MNELEMYHQSMKALESDFYNRFRLNKKVLDFNLRYDLNEIILHHYFISEMKRKYSLEIEATLREIELRTGLSFHQVRASINKLEKLGVFEVTKGGGRTPNIYKYITD